MRNVKFFMFFMFFIVLVACVNEDDILSMNTVSIKEIELNEYGLEFENKVINDKIFSPMDDPEGWIMYKQGESYPEEIQKIINEKKQKGKLIVISENQILKGSEVTPSNKRSKSNSCGVKAKIELFPTPHEYFGVIGESMAYVVDRPYSTAHRINVYDFVLEETVYSDIIEVAEYGSFENYQIPVHCVICGSDSGWIRGEILAFNPCSHRWEGKSIWYWH